LEQREDEIGIVTQEVTETRGQLKQLENELANNHEVVALIEQSERDAREACTLSERLQDQIGKVTQEVATLTEMLQQKEADTAQEKVQFIERL